MREDLDDRLHDAVALDEIHLYGDVLSAVAASDRPLTDDEIDAVLGLSGLNGELGARPANHRRQPSVDGQTLRHR